MNHLSKCSFHRRRLFSSFCRSPSPSPANLTAPSTPLPPLLALLSRCSGLAHLAQAHAFMVSRGLDRDNLLLGKLLDACASLGFGDYSFSIFERKEDPDVYLCNTVIKGLCRRDEAEAAVALFNRIQTLGVRPDTYSFPFVLKAATRLSMLELGRGIHGQIVRFGLVDDLHISTALLIMYSNCGSIIDAQFLFDGMPLRDVTCWNAMISGYVKVGDVDSARELFDQMPERNVISWTTLIAGFAQLKKPDMAIMIFRQMQQEDKIKPDQVALMAALSACTNLGALDLGEWIHRFIDKQGLYKTVPLMNALIDMYAKCGNILKALDVFESIKNKSVITWTTMIAGLSLHGLGSEALEIFQRMIKENVQPNNVTFLAVLSACSHGGLTDHGRWYFEHMNSSYHIQARIQHFGCMIDLLGRAGCLNEACNLIKNMPFAPNGAIWGSLLAAARSHGDLAIGEYALKHLLEVEPCNSGNYILLTNIYAAQGKWDDARKLRKVMKDKGVKNLPGASSIEVDGTVHEFTSRDGSHPHFDRIYQVLCDINGHMQIVGGFVSNLHGQILNSEEG